MWNRAHLDRRKHRFAERALFQQRFGCAHGLVVAHVLVHGERDAGSFTSMYGFERFGVIHPERFLREDAFDGLVRAGGFDQRELRIWRNGDVEDFDAWVVEQCVV